MQVAAAGTGVRLVRRLDQRPAGRRRPTRSTRPGRCTPGWSAAPWNAASTRAGTCTRRSCRPGSRPPTRSSATARRPPSTGCARYLERPRGRRRSTSRPPPGALAGSSCAAWTAARSTTPSADGSRSSGVADRRLASLVLRSTWCCGSRRASRPDGERPAGSSASATAGSPPSTATGDWRPATERRWTWATRAAARAGRHARARQRAGPHRVGGLRHRHPGGRGRRRHHHRRHAAELPAADASTSTRCEIKRAAAAGQCHVDVGFWGGAVPGNARRPAARCTTPACSGSRLPGRLRRARVPAARPRPRWTRRWRAVDALFVVHAEDPATVRAAARHRRYARLPRLPPAGGRARARSRTAIDGGPAHRRAGAHPAPVRRRRRCR